MTDITSAIDKKIAEIEAQLSALKAARAAFVGAAARRGRGAAAPARRRKRKFTAAQRAEISRRMKATWAARRRAKEKK